MKFTICFLFLAGIIIIAGGIYHEQVHIANWKNYGGNGEIHLFSEFPNMATFSKEGGCHGDSNCLLGHTINEAVSYNLVQFALLFIVAFSIIIYILETRLKNE